MNKETIDRLLKENPVDPRFSLRDHEKSRSDVWCMFQLVFFENKQLSYAQCKECKNILSYSGKIGTASLLRHKCYIIKHFTPKELHRQAQRSPPSVENVSVLTPHDRGVPASRISSLAHDQIAFVTRDLQPFRVMEGEGFKALAQSLINVGADYGRQDVENVLTLRKGLAKTLLPAVYNDIRRDIKEMLENKNISFAVDIWPDNSDNKFIIVLTAHLLYNFKFRKILLGTRELMEKTPSNVHHAIVDIISEYYSDKEQALQMIAEGKLVSSDETVRDGFDSAVIVPSACDNLNGVLDQVLSDKSEIVSSIVSSCNELCRYLNNSGLNRRLSKPLKCANCNHWDSIYLLLENISRNYPQILDLLAETNASHILEEKNLTVLTSLKKFMDLFKECTQSLSSDGKSTLNEVILWRFKILNYLSATENDSDFIKELKEKTKHLFDEKFTLHELHYIALFLNPDFKGMKFLDVADRQAVIDKVSEMIKADTTEDTHLESVAKKRKLCKEDRFAEFRDSSDSEESYSSEIGQYIHYQSTELDILDFWRTATMFPRLQRLALRILNIPATTICGGREFSTMRKALKNRGNGVLSDDHDMILFLHANSSYAT